MMQLLKKMASLRLSLAGMAALAVVAVAAAGRNGIDTAYAAIPIGVLIVNLLAALATSRSFRTQTGLLVFHVGLLLVFLLAGLTVLSRFDGHVEVVQGGEFAAQAVEIEEQGWLHSGRLDRVHFVQGPIRVDYLPGLRRRATRSAIEVANGGGGVEPLTIGDRDTAVLGGYRFAATFNKGFAVIVGWQGHDGRVQYGSIHFPSYPENDWNQRIDWTTPAGEALVLELQLGEPPIRPNETWTLGRTDLPFTLRVTGGSDAVLAAGESLAVAGGHVSVEALRLWMGYRVDYLPLLPWMLAAAFLAIGGLALHYRSHYLRPAKSAQRSHPVKGGMLDVTAA